MITFGPVVFEVRDHVRASVIVLVRVCPENAVQALRSVRRHVDSSVAYEVIVVANGLDDADYGVLQRCLRGVTLIRCRENTGFSGGCNLAAARARGEFLVFLNDDVLVEPRWLETLIDAADAMPRAGAIGSKILFLNGSVQEAGSVMWRDGSTTPVGRYGDADDPRIGYRRRVDYCSACSLLVRRATFRAAGGFDESFFPAYYEDTDLALAIRARGEEIWYEPRSAIRHIEAASTVGRFRSFLFRRNKARFVDKWGVSLLAQPPAHPEQPRAMELAIHAARGSPVRVLAVDDRVPLADVGSGFRRMFELLDDLAEDGHFSIAIYPTGPPEGDLDALGDRGIEVIREPLERYLRRPGIVIDAAVISRPHNYEAAAPMIRALQPRAAVIYDVESLFHRRVALQATFATPETGAGALLEQAAVTERLERRIAQTADRIVCIATEEWDYLHEIEEHAPVELLRPVLRGISFGDTPAAQRRDVLFVAGWMAGPTSPNVDGYRWFVREIWPAVLRAVPGARFRVTGGGPPREVRELAASSVDLLGYVADLEAAYGCARVVVAPIRYGAGVKNKTMEALQYGTPSVATTVGAEGMGLADGEGIDITDDPAEFASRVVALLLDDEHWTMRAKGARAVVSRWYAEDTPNWSGVIARAMQSKSNSARKRVAPAP